MVQKRSSESIYIGNYINAYHTLVCMDYSVNVLVWTGLHVTRVNTLIHVWNGKMLSYTKPCMNWSYYEHERNFLSNLCHVEHVAIIDIVSFTLNMYVHVFSLFQGINHIFELTCMHLS